MWRRTRAPRAVGRGTRRSRTAAPTGRRGPRRGPAVAASSDVILTASLRRYYNCYTGGAECLKCYSTSTPGCKVRRLVCIVVCDHTASTKFVAVVPFATPTPTFPSPTISSSAVASTPFSSSTYTLPPKDRKYALPPGSSLRAMRVWPTLRARQAPTLNPYAPRPARLVKLGATARMTSGCASVLCPTRTAAMRRTTCSPLINLSVRPGAVCSGAPYRVQPAEHMSTTAGYFGGNGQGYYECNESGGKTGTCFAFHSKT